MEQKNCDFSALVKQVRKQLSLSQEDLAHHLGVSYTTVNRWENEQSRPSKLAKAQFNAFCRNYDQTGKVGSAREPDRPRERAPGLENDAGSGYAAGE